MVEKDEFEGIERQKAGENGEVVIVRQIWSRIIRDKVWWPALTIEGMWSVG